MCFPEQHWVGWILQPEQTSTADALHHGNVVQKLLCGLDAWALKRVEDTVMRLHLTCMINSAASHQ